MGSVRLGFVGTRGHFRAVLAEVAEMPFIEIAGVCDGGDSAAAIVEWCGQNGRAIPRKFETVEAMLDGAKPQAVVVCGPFELHAAMCVAAIERGVHVLTEKPAALNFEELARLREICSKD